ncbi:MAG: hypothetical protein ACREQI_00290 [Candidatus Binataceae bacterium]
MKLAALLTIPAVIALAAASAAPANRPGAPAHSQLVARPEAKVFAAMKGYFGNPFTTDFTLVSADAATNTLVATQSTTDLGTWSGWAYCIAAPMTMFGGGAFQSGSARLTVKLAPGQRDKNSTLVSVSGDFTGIYRIGGRTDRTACGSKGRLEAAILSAASGK